MYKEVLEKHGITQTAEDTLKVLTYEVGNLHKIDMYIKRFGQAGYLGERKVELADAITMICLMIEQNGFSVEELTKVGFERFDHRMSEVKAKGISK